VIPRWHDPSLYSGVYISLLRLVDRTGVSRPSLRWRCSSLMVIHRWCSCGVTVYSLQRLTIYTYSRGLGYDHLPVCKVQLTSFSCAWGRWDEGCAEAASSTGLRDWACCEGWWVVTCDDDESMVRMSVWFRTWEYIITFDAFLRALRMQTIAKLLGLSDFFIFYFPPKLIRCWPWPAHIW
jgi:hypothetical protein